MDTKALEEMLELLETKQVEQGTLSNRDIRAVLRTLLRAVIWLLIREESK